MIPGSANPLLLAADAAAGGYSIARSLRFNSADSASLNRTFGSGGNRRTWTLSAWIKRSAIAFSAEQHIWGVTGTTDATYGEMFFGTGDTLRFAVGYNTTYGITTTRVFRDPSAWYHIVLAFDATQSTAANKIRLYVNGVEETAFSSDTRSSLANQDWGYNNNVAHYIGRQPNSDIRQFNGYLADVWFIDGQQLTPSSFGESDATTGVWNPKAYSGTYGTNGGHWTFEDNSNNTASTLGKDTSGNGNNWTPNNLQVTGGSAIDSLKDSPTNGSASSGADPGGSVVGNYATLNPLTNIGSYPSTLSNGNLEFVGTSSSVGPSMIGTIGVSSGKWYFEAVPSTANAVTSGQVVGVVGTQYNPVADSDSYFSRYSFGYAYRGNGQKENNNTAASYGASYVLGDVIGVAFDLDAGTITFYKNGSSQGQAYSGLSGTFVPAAYAFSSRGWTLNFGQRPFAYAAPSGYKSLNTANLPTPTILKGSSYFDAKLYTGNGSTQTISGLGFSPDLV